MTAKDVLEKYWDGRLPVRPVAIAKAMGIDVFKQHGIAESGRVSIEDGITEIVFNADDAHVRQRFTVAHEIGHVALGHVKEGGRTLMRDDRASFLASAHDPREVTANQFAARLLMPAGAVKTAFVKMPNIDISTLASMFDVSEAAMRYRLINLGLIHG